MIGYIRIMAGTRKFIRWIKWSPIVSTNEETGQRILIAGNFGTDTVTLPLEKQADRVLLTNGKAVDEILNGNRESTSLVLGSCDCVVLLLGQ